jgi:hypothetical protein
MIYGFVQPSAPSNEYGAVDASPVEVPSGAPGQQ